MIDHKKFLYIEKKFQLFNLKNSFNEYYWDFIRYFIGTKLIINHEKDFQYSKKNNSKINKIFLLLRDFIILIINIIKKKKYIIYHSDNYDIIDNYLNLIGRDKFLIINNKDNSNLKYNEISCSLSKLISLFYFNKFNKQFKNIRIQNFDKIFKTKINKYVKHLVIKHYKEELFHILINKIFKPKAIFFVNSGNKNIITAAKKSKIKIYEIQHGEINSLSLLNNYPKKIEKIKTITPDKIFLFSNYWSRINYYSEKVNIGINKEFLNSNKKSKLLNIIFVLNISNEEYFLKLIEYVCLKKKNIKSKIKIYLKPHPMYPERENYYIKKTKNLNMVKILPAKKKINDFIKNNSVIVTSYSSTIYETLQSNQIVACDLTCYPLYGKEIKDLKHKNLYYFKNPSGLLRIFNKKRKKNNFIFYQKFDKQKLLRSI